jgi:hypothetical protein
MESDRMNATDKLNIIAKKLTTRNFPFYIECNDFIFANISFEQEINDIQKEKNITEAEISQCEEAQQIWSFRFHQNNRVPIFYGATFEIVVDKMFNYLGHTK